MTIKDHIGSNNSGLVVQRATFQRYHTGPKLGKQPGHTISKWLYGIEGKPADIVKASGYFDEVADELGKGDIIEVVANFDKTPELKVFIVTNIENGVVTVAASS